MEDSQNKKDMHFMKLAYQQALKAQSVDEVPVGCIIVDGNGVILGRSYNHKEKQQQPTGHAELLCIQKVCKKIKTWHLDGCTLYVTLEPCMMCMGTIIQSRIKRVVFGAYDPKGGCCQSCINISDVKGFNHYPIIKGGVYQQECSSLLTNYFRNKRKGKQ